MKFYNYSRSGTSRRVQIALKLKGVTYEDVQIDLLANAHHQEEFERINPQKLVPALQVSSELVLTQSPAILEWLDACYPEPLFLPKQEDERARVRALAAIIGCDTHPLNNKRVLEYLRFELKADKNQVKAWANHWIEEAFTAYEKILASDKMRQRFSVGNTPSMAEIYLIPQVESSQRFQVDISQWPCIAEVFKACQEIEAFRSANFQT